MGGGERMKWTARMSHVGSADLPSPLFWLFCCKWFNISSHDQPERLRCVLASSEPNVPEVRCTRDSGKIPSSHPVVIRLEHPSPGPVMCDRRNTRFRCKSLNLNMKSRSSCSMCFYGWAGAPKAVTVSTGTAWIPSERLNTQCGALTCISSLVSLPLLPQCMN